MKWKRLFKIRLLIEHTYVGKQHWCIAERYEVMLAIKLVKAMK